VFAYAGSIQNLKDLKDAVNLKDSRLERRAKVWRYGGNDAGAIPRTLDCSVAGKD
jgi:hypothetical protein